MKRLLDMLNKLPPEMRSLLAMMGLGSFAGIIYFMSKHLGMSVFQICIAMLVVGAVIAVGGTLISKGFNFRAKRRARRMADELGKSAESGPASMDARAAIKANNEKFFNAIREMRKTLGVNVYDLPWYIVIGDSGCGKTKLVNEGGLTFSAGKPEGYQLGTLNYNWWFTEDAIFVDMAGRLCNPQEDGDRREWLAFLDTVGKGRRGYPINGALVCVSAEHLLEDAPEKIEADANTMLERLRDLQTRLGVTFGTYLLVTKCDKILGFMQFFDRAERDITMKNQIFGWSKPGDFNQLYDPEQFGTDFDAVYSRLNDLRIRRLQDETDEVDLGLAYTFPEEFREFREPLQIYVRTLFPMIKNPRAIKNLVFRGVYFTSATQQGGLILKHLTTRLGADAANQFSPLESMYPQPRPHFVKDLLFKKVFPEQGLVFRNEQEVVRHRRLAKTLLYGSFVGLAGLMGLLAWSCSAIGNLISVPEAHVAQGRLLSPQSPVEVAATVNQLRADEKTLEKGKWMARILSLGLGADDPIRHLRTIQTGLFRRYVVAQAIREVEAALQNPPGGKLTDENRGGYESALLAYLQWVSAADPADSGTPSAPAASIKYSDNPLWKFVKASAGTDKKDAPVPVATSEAFAALWDLQKDTELDKGESSLPRLTAASGQWSPQQAVQVTQAAATHLRACYEPYARLDKNNPDPIIREWIKVRDACDRAHGTYDVILKANSVKPASVDEYRSYISSLNDSVQKFTSDLDLCSWTLKDPGNNKPVPLQDLQKAVQTQWTRWNELAGSLQKACRMKAARDHLPPLQRLASAETDGLNAILAESAKRHNAGATTQPAEEAPTTPQAPFVREVTDAYKYMIQRAGADQPGGGLGLTAEAQTVQQHLKGVLVQLHGSAATRPAARYLPDWLDYFDHLSEPPPQVERSLGALSAEWRRPELEALLNAIAGVVRRGEIGTALTVLAEQARNADKNWGLAALEAADYLEPIASSLGRMEIATARAPEPRRAPEPAKPEPAPEPAPTRRRSWRDRTPDTPQAPAPTPATPAAPAPTPTSDLVIPKCATRAFLHDAIADASELEEILRQLNTDAYIGDAGLIKALQTELEAVKLRYPEHYFSEWKRLHDAIDVKSLRPVVTASDWRAYRRELQDPKASTDVASQLRAMCAELFEHVIYVEAGWTEPILQSFRPKLLSIRESKWNTRFRTDGYQPNRTLASKPWVDIADTIAEGWSKFSSALAADRYPDFPSSFADPKSAAPAAAVDWSPTRNDTIESLFGEFHPIDRLLHCARRGQTLLDDEIHRILMDRQNAFGQGSDSLPYGAKDVVSLLTEIGRAESCFQAIDTDKLDRGHDARQRFYRSCTEWRTLLLDNAGGWGKALVVEKIALDQANMQNAQWVWWEVDPQGGQLTRARGRPQAGPFNFYGAIQLDLGLSWSQQSQAGQPVSIEFTRQPIETAGACEWDWVKSPGANKGGFLLFKGGGIYGEWPDCRGFVPAAQNPALAFCELLEKYGIPDPANNDRHSWYLTVMWRLCDIAARQQNAAFAAVAQRCGSIKPEASQVGVVMRFTLRQVLPRPYERLAPLPSAAPPGGVAERGS